MPAELTTIEHADHLVRRKDLWEKREKTGGPSCPTSLSDGRSAGPQHQKGFAAATIGMSKSAINLALSRALSVAAEKLGSDLCWSE